MAVQSLWAIVLRSQKRNTTRFLTETGPIPARRDYKKGVGRYRYTKMPWTRFP